jgi:hypothetical protein
MCQRISCALFLLAFTFYAPKAEAVFIELDVLAPGDLLATHDTVQNVVWLDLTLTVGLSYDDILAGAGGWVGMGWRFATGEEVCGLFAQVNSVQTQQPSCPRPRRTINWAPGEGDPGEVEALMDLLGVTGQEVGIGDVTIGFYDDGTPGIVGSGSLFQAYSPGHNGQTLALDDFLTSDFTFHDQASFLVKRFFVPEPSAALLLALGVAGLRVMRARRGA